jgi:hypothetical protein
VERQVIVDKQYIWFVAQDGIRKAVNALFIYKRGLLVYQVKIDMSDADIGSVTSEVLFHVIAEVASLLPHVVIGMQDNHVVVGLAVTAAQQTARSEIQRSQSQETYQGKTETGCSTDKPASLREVLFTTFKYHLEQLSNANLTNF